jgi:hypothetical protein
LLLPSSALQVHAVHGEPSIQRIGTVARRFATSLTATTRRLMDLTDLACAMVWSRPKIRNYAIQAACMAVQPNEASRQDATVEELAKLAFDEAGYRGIPLALPRQEGFQVPGNSRIEGTIFRLARTIGRIDSHAVSLKQAPWQLSGSRIEQDRQPVIEEITEERDKFVALVPDLTTSRRRATLFSDSRINNSGVRLTASWRYALKQSF